MTRTLVGRKNGILSNTFVLAGLGLALSLGTISASAQQNQTGDAQATVEQQQDSPSQAPQDQQVVPSTLTLPAGTVIRLRVDEWLSSDRNLPGDAFSATLDEPIVVDGWVVARRGQSETGTVSEAKKAGRIKGTSELGLQLNQLTLVDGQQLPLQTQMLQTSAGAAKGRDAAAIGTTTGVGAAIGAIADEGAGAAIGAGAGAVAGIIGVLSTRGKQTVIPPETLLSFRLQTPVTISTERSQVAFLPVTQQDYDAREPTLRRQHMAAPRRSIYPPYYYDYAYPWYPYPYGFYPGAFSFGFYGDDDDFGRGFGRGGFGRRGFGHRGGGRRR